MASDMEYTRVEYYELGSVSPAAAAVIKRINKDFDCGISLVDCHLVNEDTWWVNGVVYPDGLMDVCIMVPTASHGFQRAVAPLLQGLKCKTLHSRFNGNHSFFLLECGQ